MFSERLYFVGDRVVWTTIHGVITNVFEGKNLIETLYRVDLDGGGCCHSANVYELEPEPPLESLARVLSP